MVMEVKFKLKKKDSIISAIITVELRGEREFVEEIMVELKKKYGVT